MAAQSAPTRSYSLKQALAARLASKHGIDPTAAADAGDTGAAILDNFSRAKATKGKEQTKYIAAAQAGLRRLDAKKHATLINGVQAKLLALQGRGGDTKVAHVTPGEVVIPRSVLTQELAELIATEAAKQGIDPGRFVVGGEQASVNPHTGAEEFGFGEWIKDSWKKTKEAFNPESEPQFSVQKITETAPAPPISDTINDMRQNLEMPVPSLACPVGAYTEPRKKDMLYGMRMHPTKHVPKVHEGIDIANPLGAPIYAVEDGTLAVTGPGLGKENRAHVQGQTTGNLYPFAHVTLADGLKQGNQVKAGQVIGYTDKSGGVTGPHLHAGLVPGADGKPAAINGKRVDPLDFYNRICAANGLRR